MTHNQANPKSQCAGELRIIDDRKSLGGGPRRTTRRCRDCGNLVVNDGDDLVTDGLSLIPAGPMENDSGEPYPGYSDGWWF